MLLSGLPICFARSRSRYPDPMNAFLELPEARRRAAFLQVNEQMELQAVSVEKDLWVCWTLRELFDLPGIGGHLTFKGGTSLSKAWKLIHRFSEDIDLVVDKELLGFGEMPRRIRHPARNRARPAWRSWQRLARTGCRRISCQNCTKESAHLWATMAGVWKWTRTCRMDNAFFFTIPRFSPRKLVAMCVLW